MLTQEEFSTIYKQKFFVAFDTANMMEHPKHYLTLTELLSKSWNNLEVTMTLITVLPSTFLKTEKHFRILMKISKKGIHARLEHSQAYLSK